MTLTLTEYNATTAYSKDALVKVSRGLPARLFVAAQASTGKDPLTTGAEWWIPVAAGPPGADGKDGAPGKDGTIGKDGAPGKDGKEGPPGTPATNLVSGKEVTTPEYTLAATDVGVAVDCNSNGLQTVSLPPDVLPVGAVGEVCRVGPGALTVLAASGVTVIPARASFTAREVGSTIGWRCRAPNVFVLSGDYE